MAQDHYDAIVIGIGAMGSAACWQLARAGRRVLGLEQFSLAHDRGSSHGQTRLIRRAYFEHPDYVPLVQRAYELWEELEDLSGRSLLHRCGLLLAGTPDSRLLCGVRAAAAQHRLDLEELLQTDVERRFPGVALRPDQVAMFEPGAGYLLVEDCVRAQARLAAQLGAILRFDEPVRRWHADDDAIRVHTDRGVYSAERLILTAGAWSQDLLSALQLPLEVQRRMQLWFGVTDARYTVGAGFPAFAIEVESGFFYGFPAIEPGCMKVAEHLGRQPNAHPERLDRDLHDADVTEVRQFIRRHLPGVSTSVVRHSACMYTMTPDEHFVVDRTPDDPRIVFAAGFSGHGFKFAPIVGQVLAELAIEGRTREPTEFLRLNAPGRQLRSA